MINQMTFDCVEWLQIAADVFKLTRVGLKLPSKYGHIIWCGRIELEDFITTRFWS